MPAITRREGQDLKVLVTAILQFSVSTFNKNVTFFKIHLYICVVI